MVTSVFLGRIFPFSSRTILFLIIVLLFQIQTTIRAVVDISDKFGNCSVKSSYKANNNSVSFTINLPEVKHKAYLALEFDENVNYALVFISTSSSSTRAGFLDVGVYEDMWDRDIVFKHDVRFDPERHRLFKIGFPSLKKFPIIVQYTEKIFDPNYYAIFNVTILPAYRILDQKTSRCSNNHGKINESLQTDSVYTVPMCFNCSEILTETEELHLQQKFPEFRKNLFEDCRKEDNDPEKKSNGVNWGLVVGVIFLIVLIVIVGVIYYYYRKRIMKAIQSVKSSRSESEKKPEEKGQSSNPNRKSSDDNCEEEGQSSNPNKKSFVANIEEKERESLINEKENQNNQLDRLVVASPAVDDINIETYSTPASVTGGPGKKGKVSLKTSAPGRYGFENDHSK